MVTNNEAVDNFLNGKRNLAAYQFSQLIKETTSLSSCSSSTASSPGPPQQRTSSSPLAAGISPSILSLSSATSNVVDTGNLSNVVSPSAAVSQSMSTSSTSTSAAAPGKQQQQPNSDEIAFNYAMINLFTGCPQRAAVIFSDLVKRYPRNPRLWLRLAESMLAAERAKMTEFEHVQQLAYPHSRDHLIKTKNKPILIKINPNYCQQQIQQQFQLQRSTPSNFLVTIKGYLQKSLELINEYNDISLLTDDIPNPPMQITQQQPQLIGHTIGSSIASTSSPSAISSSMLTDSSSPSLLETQTPKLSHQLSYANPYQSISRSDLYHLRNKVQLNLAYICLCMGEPGKALNYTTQCLKSSPQGYEKVLANLYHAEACILASRFDEAIQFLNLEVLNMAKNLSREHPVVKGDTKRVVYGEEMQRQLESGALATVVTYNLSVAYAAKGEFGNAYKILMRSGQPTKPNPMQIIICLLYIQLQQGQLESAKRIILNNLPQFR